MYWLKSNEGERRAMKNAALRGKPHAGNSHIRWVCALAGAGISLSLCAGGQFRAGFPEADVDAARLRDGFRAPPPGYGEVPFWWWTGERLDERRLVEQVEQLHAAGVSGVQVNYSHTRSGGMRTADVEPPIFSDEWWRIFNVVAEACARRGMGIGLSGYTIDWPGPDNLFARLGINAPETQARHLTANCARRPDGGMVTEARAGTLDPLNPESAQRLITRFLSPFEQRLSPLARTALNYFFQDELTLGGGCYYSGPLRLWSEDFAAEFKARKGYDIVPLLKGLFGDVGPLTNKVRLDYNDVLMALTEERYFKPIYDWHAGRGLVYGCDPSSRGRRPMEFGDYMRAVRWYTAPGFDTPGGSADLIKNKVGSSIAHLNRRPRVWLEGYHSLGWQASPATIFDTSVHNFVYGSSLLNLHGLYYSTFGGWWEWAPPCYHFHMPYWRHMPVFLKYFERLSYALTQGVHVADVAVVNPLEPLLIDSRTGQPSVELAHRIVEELVARRGVDCDFIDGLSLARAEIADGRLKVAGEAYRAIVLPNMTALRVASLEKLAKFRAAGGVVAVFGSAPRWTDAPPERADETMRLAAELARASYPLQPAEDDYARFVASLGVRDVAGPAGLKALHRRVGNCDLYYLVGLKEDAVCTFRASGRPEIWDPWTGRRRSVPSGRRNSDGTTSVPLSAASGQPILLAFTSDADGKDTPPPPSDVRPRQTAKRTLDGLWRFSLVPTLDNRWGDYRLPATKEMLGAEIRRFRVDGGAYATCGFGPQFRSADGSLHAFSWRWGEEERPGFQDWHHGLNRVVGDDFFTLGDYDRGLYDVAPGKEERSYSYETFIYVPETAPVELVAHGVAPQKVMVDDTVWTTGAVRQLSAGYRKLQVAYSTKGGRAALVALRRDVDSSPSRIPLSMKWCDDPAVLRFDPFGGTKPESVFTATVPPGFQRATMELDGELLEAKIGGRAAAVARKGQAWTVTGEGAAGETLTLKIRANPGVAGAGVFRDVVRLDCGPGIAELGDWARYDGLACYSGGAVYEKTFTLDAAEVKQEPILDLGRLSATCEVSVNGDSATVLCAPPWRVDLSGRVRAGENTLRVTVFNTLNNHYQTIPTRYKRPIAEAPSGLLGPVTF